MLVPHVVEQLLLGDDLSGPRHEVAQKGELLGCQVEGGAITGGMVAGRVEVQPADFQHRPRTAGVPTQEGADPCAQLVEGERLDQVVVGTGVQPADPVAHGVAGGEHQDPGCDPLHGVRPEALAHLQSVDARHRQVEADQVIGRERGLFECFITVGGRVDGIALAAQATRQCLYEVDFVVDDENPHFPTVLRAGTAKRAGSLIRMRRAPRRPLRHGPRRPAR